MCGCLVPECKFRAGRQVARSVNELEIADEAALDVTEARVVDVRCLEPDTTRVMVFLRLGRFEVAVETG